MLTPSTANRAPHFRAAFETLAEVRTTNPLALPSNPESEVEINIEDDEDERIVVPAVTVAAPAGVLSPLPEDEEDHTAHANEKIRLLGDELNQMATIRKDRVFDSEVTTEEAELIRKRVALQQERFRMFEERDFQTKSKKILAVFDYLTADEIKHALKECGHNEDSVVTKMTEPGYLKSIRRAIALEGRSNKSGDVATPNSSPKQQHARRKKQKVVDDDVIPSRIAKSRFTIDAIAEPDADPTEVFAGWSQARVVAYKSIDACPNRYYYRFNKPGEMQRNGVWTEAEKKLFLERLNEVGANGQWGIFSMPIPGRVGYQCATFYRSLVKSGKLKDANYSINSKGALQFRASSQGPEEESIIPDEPDAAGRRGIKRKSSDTNKPKPSSSTATSTNEPPMTDLQKSIRERLKRNKPSKKPKKKQRAAADADDSGDTSAYSSGDGSDSESEDFDDEVEEVVVKPKRVMRSVAKPVAAAVVTYESVSYEAPSPPRFSDPLNPLPGFIDPITLEEVVRPAISPYGHVVGYDTWVSCLNNKMCPFTKKPLSRRDLIILTLDNIDEYR
ncbi:hypothetical protein HDU98_009129 [Podochytrium sp. JEL0797]|nr:hypothetical protein HDU98_009129 [Podochytrium sp. JEL0797]